MPASVSLANSRLVSSILCFSSVAYRRSEFPIEKMNSHHIARWCSVRVCVGFTGVARERARFHSPMQLILTTPIFVGLLQFRRARSKRRQLFGTTVTPTPPRQHTTPISRLVRVVPTMRAPPHSAALSSVRAVRSLLLSTTTMSSCQTRTARTCLRRSRVRQVITYTRTHERYIPLVVGSLRCTPASLGRVRRPLVVNRDDVVRALDAL
jgi:hypothetical protein